MGRYYFTVGSTTQDVVVRTDDISASGKEEYPILRVPLTLKMRPHFSKRFDVLNVKAILKATDRNIICSETFSQLSITVYNESEHSVHLTFPITNQSIFFIEKLRKENIRFGIDLKFQMALYETLSIQGGLNKVESFHVVTAFHTDVCEVSFEIQQSYWIKKVLPGLGHDHIRLIEIPNYNEIISEEYEKAVKELEAANNYFLNGDYDKVVAHCRAAVESVKKKLPDIKKALTSESEYDWIKKVAESTDAWLTTMTKATWELSSKTHHFPTLDHFSREQAEIIKLITVGIVAFTGKIQNNKKS